MPSPPRLPRSGGEAGPIQSTIQAELIRPSGRDLSTLDDIRTYGMLEKGSKIDETAIRDPDPTPCPFPPSHWDWVASPAREPAARPRARAAPGSLDSLHASIHDGKDGPPHGGADGTAAPLIPAADRGADAECADDEAAAAASRATLRLNLRPTSPTRATSPSERPRDQEGASPARTAAGGGGASPPRPSLPLFHSPGSPQKGRRGTWRPAFSPLRSSRARDASAGTAPSTTATAASSPLSSPRLQTGARAEALGTPVLGGTPTPRGPHASDAPFASPLGPRLEGDTPPRPRRPAKDASSPGTVRDTPLLGLGVGGDTPLLGRGMESGTPLLGIELEGNTPLLSPGIGGGTPLLVSMLEEGTPVLPLGPFGDSPGDIHFGSTPERPKVGGKAPLSAMRLLKPLTAIAPVGHAVAGSGATSRERLESRTGGEGYEEGGPDDELGDLGSGGGAFGSQIPINEGEAASSAQPGGPPSGAQARPPPPPPGADPAPRVPAAPGLPGARLGFAGLAAFDLGTYGLGHDAYAPPSGHTFLEEAMRTHRLLSAASPASSLGRLASSSLAGSLGRIPGASPGASLGLLPTASPGTSLGLLGCASPAASLGRFAAFSPGASLGHTQGSPGSSLGRRGASPGSSLGGRRKGLSRAGSFEWQLLTGGCSPVESLAGLPDTSATPARLRPDAGRAPTPSRRVEGFTPSPRSRGGRRGGGSILAALDETDGPAPAPFDSLGGSPDGRPRFLEDPESPTPVGGDDWGSTRPTLAPSLEAALRSARRSTPDAPLPRVASHVAGASRVALARPDPAAVAAAAEAATAYAAAGSASRPARRRRLPGRLRDTVAVDDESPAAARRVSGSGKAGVTSESEGDSLPSGRSRRFPGDAGGSSVRRALFADGRARGSEGERGPAATALVVPTVRMRIAPRATAPPDAAAARAAAAAAAGAGATFARRRDGSAQGGRAGRGGGPAADAACGWRDAVGAGGARDGALGRSTLPAGEGLARSRGTGPPPDPPGGHRGCRCRKSRCLKLYCDCFAAGVPCGAACQCAGCQNGDCGSEAVAAARRAILQRNPRAFDRKIVAAGSGQAGEATEAATATALLSPLSSSIAALPRAPAPPGRAGSAEPPGDGASLVHSRGCKCRRSRCRKRYCECFQAGVACTAACRCENCLNGTCGGAGGSGGGGGAAPHTAAPVATAGSRGHAGLPPPWVAGGRANAPPPSPRPATPPSSLGPPLVPHPHAIPALAPPPPGLVPSAPPAFALPPGLAAALAAQPTLASPGLPGMAMPMPLMLGPNGALCAVGFNPAGPRPDGGPAQGPPGLYLIPIGNLIAAGPNGAAPASAPPARSITAASKVAGTAAPTTSKVAETTAPETSKFDETTAPEASKFDETAVARPGAGADLAAPIASAMAETATAAAAASAVLATAATATTAESPDSGSSPSRPPGAGPMSPACARAARADARPVKKAKTPPERAAAAGSSPPAAAPKAARPEGPPPSAGRARALAPLCPDARAASNKAGDGSARPAARFDAATLEEVSSAMGGGAVRVSDPAPTYPIPTVGKPAASALRAADGATMPTRVRATRSRVADAGAPEARTTRSRAKRARC